MTRALEAQRLAWTRQIDSTLICTFLPSRGHAYPQDKPSIGTRTCFKYVFNLDTIGTIKNQPVNRSS